MPLNIQRLQKVPTNLYKIWCTRDKQHCEFSGNIVDVVRCLIYDKFSQAFQIQMRYLFSYSSNSEFLLIFAIKWCVIITQDHKQKIDKRYLGPDQVHGMFLGLLKLNLKPFCPMTSGFSPGLKK